jgi:hypothetical protein
VEDVPWVFGVHRISFGLVQPWMRNYKPNELDHLRGKYYRIDPAAKK